MSKVDTREKVDEILTVFYSKHSGNCKALLQYLKTLQYCNIKGIKYINIDVPELRSLAQRKFSTVPALVVLHGDNISLFTGENVFEWFAERERQIPLPPLADTNPVSLPAKSIQEMAAEMMKEREHEECAQSTGSKTLQRKH